MKSEYMKKDLSQVNHQLYEWLAIVNERSDGSSTTTNSIRDNAENVNTNEQNSRENIRYSISENQNTRDENYVNNKLKTYTYADVENIVDNLAVNKYGDDVVLRDKKNVGKQKQK